MQQRPEELIGKASETELNVGRCQDSMKNIHKPYEKAKRDEIAQNALLGKSMSEHPDLAQFALYQNDET